MYRLPVGYCKQNTMSSMLAEDFSQLVNDSLTADLVFIIGSPANRTEFSAHKLVVWARCPSFRKYQQDFWEQKHSASEVLTMTYNNFEPEAFYQVLKYIYTGQLSLDDSAVLPVLVVAASWDLPGLVTLVDEYVRQNLSSDNACLFLSASLRVISLGAGQSEAVSREVSLQDVCLSYVLQHAERCIQTDGWLQLPKTTILSLVSSPQFTVDGEHLVWHAVLTWAKYNSGILLDKDPASWNDHERSLITQTLEGILEHIKFFLIDSQTFAEEVEPTGLVPMETTLEYYRYAAVARLDNLEDVRFQPRVSVDLFPGSKILDGHCRQYQKLLNQWYNNHKQEWRLLYQASRDGFSSQDFHDHCDGHSPTFVIIKGVTGSVCGGFSDVAWTSKAPARGQYLPSHRAFLFTLVNQQEILPTCYPIRNSVLATLHHPDYGPIFGGGADLCIASNCQVGMTSYSNFPHTYSAASDHCSVLMGDYHFCVSDYEVFTTAAHSL